MVLRKKAGMNGIKRVFGVAMVAAGMATAFGQGATTGTMTMGPSDFGKMSEYYDYGMRQWMVEAQKAKAAGNTEGAIEATRKQMAYMQAKQVAAIAERKTELTGSAPKVLPTPGLAPAHYEKDESGIKVVGELDPELNLHNTGYDPTYIRVYNDYFYAMDYWLNFATEAKRINDTAEMQIGLRNAEAFENAYLALKNAEMQAEAAGKFVEVTPVPGLPRFPSTPVGGRVVATAPMSSAPYATPRAAAAAVAAVATPAAVAATPVAGVAAAANPVAPVVPAPAAVVGSTPLPAHFARHLAPKADFTPVAVETAPAGLTPVPAAAVAAADAAAEADDDGTTGGRVFKLSDRTFSMRTEKGTWLVEFGATWCGPCKLMKPIMDEVASEMGGVKFGAVDIDRSKSTSRKFKVKGVPTFVLLKDGAIVDTHVGMMSEAKLKSFATQ